MLMTSWRAIRSNLLSLLKFSRLYISAYQSCNFHQRPLCTTSTSQPASVCLPIILQSTTKRTNSELKMILECVSLFSCPIFLRDLFSISVLIVLWMFLQNLVKHQADENENAFSELFLTHCWTLLVQIPPQEIRSYREKLFLPST
jgi:hypothetical protein